MQFRVGMACCNSYRANAGLCCDLDRQLECASAELGRLALHAPARVPAFLKTLLPIFPVDMLLVRARQVGHIDDFISTAACHCAAIGTKTERRLFFGFIAGFLTPQQIETFTALHDTEWRRLRGT